MRWTVFCARAVGWMAAFGVCLLLMLWLYGQTVSDRWYPLQFIAWAPSWTVLVPAAVLAFISMLTCVGATEHMPARLGARASQALLGAVAVALICVHLLELRWGNMLCAGVPAGKASVRVAHWNLDAFNAQQWEGDIAQTVRDDRLPDVLLLSSNQTSPCWRKSIASLESTHTLNRSGNYAVFSTMKVLSLRRFSLGLLAMYEEKDAVTRRREQRVRKWLEDSWNAVCEQFGISRRAFAEGEDGSLIVVTLDAAATLGRPLTVYYIDLPSDLFMARYSAAVHVRARLDAIAGADAPGGPVPKPDVLIGDFNSPRGSASVGLIAGSLRHAFDAAGWGHAVSFPRVWSMLHIDHTFVARWLGVGRYVIKTPPAGDHRLQMTDIYAQ